MGGSRTTRSDAANTEVFPAFNNSMKGENKRWVIELEGKDHMRLWLTSELGKRFVADEPQIYLLSLELNGTTWIPSGPPPFDTSTGLSRSLRDNNGGQISKKKPQQQHGHIKDGKRKQDKTAVFQGGRLKRLTVVHFDYSGSLSTQGHL